MKNVQINFEGFSWFILPLAFLGFYLGFPYLREGMGGFLIFVFFFVLFPSFCFGRLFLKNEEGVFSWLTLGYPPTLVFIFVTQWLDYFFNLNLFLWVVPVVAAALWVGMPGLRKPFSFSRSRPSWTLAGVYLVALIFHALTVVWPEAPPTVSQLAIIYPDRAWNSGNISAILKGGYPLPDLRVSGLTLGYHLFQAFYHAAVHRISGILPLFIQDFYSPILDLFFIAAAIEVGLGIILKKEKAFIRWALVGFFFTAGMGTQYNSHILTNPLTYFFSIPFFVLFMVHYGAHLSGLKKLPKLYCLILFFGACAAKGILPMVLFPVMGLTWIIGFTKVGWRKVREEFHFLTGAFLLSMILKAMIFTNSRTFEIAKGIEGSFIYQAMVSRFEGWGLKWVDFAFLSYLSAKNLYLVLMNFGGFSFVFGTLCFSDFRKRVMTNWGRVPAFLGLFVLISVLEATFIFFDGSDANPYFYWYSLSIVLFSGLVAREFVLPSAKGRLYKWGGSALFFASICFCFKLFLGPEFWRQLPPFRTSPADLRVTLDFGEWKGLEWIRQKTSIDSLVLSDRRFFSAPKKPFIARWFLYSSIGGRQMVAEGDGFVPTKIGGYSEERWKKVEVFLSGAPNGDPAALKTLSELKPDYFFQSLRFNQGDYSRVPGLKLEYENPSVRIYRVLGPNS